MTKKHAIVTAGDVQVFAAIVGAVIREPDAGRNAEGIVHYSFNIYDEYKTEAEARSSTEASSALPKGFKAPGL